jgi:hypothetical protein
MMKEELQERKRLRFTLNVTIILTAIFFLSSLLLSLTTNNISFYQSSNAQNISSTAPTPSTAISIPVYENSTYGIKIQYPSDWVYRENSRTNIVTFIPSSSLSNSILLNNTQNNISNTSTNQTNLLPLVTIGFDFLPFHNIPLNVYNNMTIKNLNQSPGINFVTSSPVVLGGNPANMIEYTEGPFTTIAIYTIIGNQLYTLAYVADSTQVSKYAPIVQQIIKSLVINSTACTINFC